MEKSLFVKFAAFFIAIAKGVTETVNGGKAEQRYFHKEMLTPELSVNLEWGSSSVNSSVVAADVVSMDATLPLKKRGALRAATGDIPKLGMKMHLSEKQLSDIDVLVARNAETKTIVERIFADTVTCTMGIYEKLEYMFLQALSSGFTVIDDANNVGLGIRLDFKYPAANSFGVVTKWSDPNAKPLDDITRIRKVAQALGKTSTIIAMDDATASNLLSNAQIRESHAFNLNFVGQNVPNLDNDQLAAVFKKKFNLTLLIVERQIVTERDGVKTIQTPWEANKVVLLPSMKVGKVIYGILAEDTRRKPSITYTKVDNFILLKKWSTDEPFSEYTSSQALVVPVINNVGDIYVINSEEAVTDAQTENNSTFDYKGVDYTKASAVAALKLAKPTSKLTTSSTDAAILKAVNELSDEQIAIFEENIVEAA